MSAQLLDQFHQLNHQDKYAKVMIYLNAVQKSEESFVGLYRVFADLGADGVNDDILTEMYTVLLSLVEYDNQSDLNEASKYLKYIQQLIQKNKNESGV